MLLLASLTRRLLGRAFRAWRILKNLRILVAMLLNRWAPILLSALWAPLRTGL